MRPVSKRFPIDDRPSVEPVATAASRRGSSEPHRLDGAAVIALAVTLVALALRLWHLTFQSLWWDEGVSIFLASAGLPALTIAKDFAVDLHPPLYHLALAGWLQLLGSSVFSDRLLSVFAGTLTIPLTFAVTRSLLAERGSPPQPAAGVSTPTALVASALAALSPIDVYYSQETRMYALLPAVGLASLYLTARLRARDRWPDWLIWSLINALGLYLYYYLGLLTLAEALFLTGLAARRGQLGRWLVAQLATLALFAPWLALMARHLGRAALALPAETAVYLTPQAYLLENWQAFTVGFTSPPYSDLLVALFGVAALLGLGALARRDRPLATLLILPLIVALLGAGAVLLIRPFFYPRFILFVVPALWIFVAAGLSAGRRAWPAALAVGILLLLGNGWTWYYERVTPRSGYAPDDYRVVFATLAARSRPGDLVLCGYPWQAGYVQAYLAERGVRTAFLPGPVEAAPLRAMLGPGQRAWVYAYSPDRTFQGNHLEQVLSAALPTLVVDQYGDSRLRLFGPAPATSPRSPLQATLGGEIGLLTSQVQVPSRPRPGSAVAITLDWLALRTPREAATVFVHLLGPDGRIYGQQDAVPVSGAFPTSQWQAGEEVIDRYRVTIAPAAPPGTYQVEVGMYRPTTGQRLVVGPAPAPDNRIVIGEFSVGG